MMVFGVCFVLYLFSTFFATKLYNFTKFRMLFPAVPMNIRNSKVCLKGESFIQFTIINMYFICVVFMNHE